MAREISRLQKAVQLRTEKIHEYVANNVALDHKLRISKSEVFLFSLS